MSDPIYRAPAPLLDEQYEELTAALGIDGTTYPAVHYAVLGVTSKEPKPTSTVLSEVVGFHRIEREHAVRAIWDLVEDERLIYDANGTIRWAERKGAGA